MGTYYGYGSRKELADEVTAGFENDFQKVTCLKRYFSGNNLWVVFERQSKAASTDRERWITVFLIRRAGSDWGYKPVDENMGPCEHSCPLSFLDMVNPPERPEGYHDWRAEVRKYHARRNQKLELNQVVTLTNGVQYRITHKSAKLMGVSLKDGVLYRIPRNMLTLPEVQS